MENNLLDWLTIDLSRTLQHQPVDKVFTCPVPLSVQNSSQSPTYHHVSSSFIPSLSLALTDTENEWSVKALMTALAALWGLSTCDQLLSSLLVLTLSMALVGLATNGPWRALWTNPQAPGALSECHQFCVLTCHTQEHSQNVICHQSSLATTLILQPNTNSEVSVPHSGVVLSLAKLPWFFNKILFIKKNSHDKSWISPAESSQN